MSEYTPKSDAASGTVTANEHRRLDGLQRALAAYSMRRKKIHSGACSANAIGRYGRREHEPDEPVVAVDRGDHRRERAQSEREHRRGDSSSVNARWNAASSPVLLAHERLVDPDPLERDDRQRRHGDDPVEARSARARAAG
jgi:hypothetical protein